MSVQERRYLLWFLEKYRQGADVAKEAHAVRAKKKVSTGEWWRRLRLGLTVVLGGHLQVRGWGPKIQNGKAIR